MMRDDDLNMVTFMGTWNFGMPYILFHRFNCQNSLLHSSGLLNQTKASYRVWKKQAKKLVNDSSGMFMENKISDLGFL